MQKIYNYSGRDCPGQAERGLYRMGSRGKSIIKEYGKEM